MKRKHPNLPNGYGSIRYLGAGRSRPYAVHPPANEQNEKGRYITPKAICYCPDWYTAFAVLAAWHAGRYTPGMEYDIAKDTAASEADLDAFCRRVLASVGMIREGKTFGQAADEYMDYKYGDNRPRDLSANSRRADEYARKMVSELDNIPLASLTLQRMQEAVNRGDGDARKGKKAGFISQVCKYAEKVGYIERNPAHLLHAPKAETRHGTPFSDRDLETLWAHQDDRGAQIILIMCYSGFRASAFRGLEVDLSQGVFTGGVKTAAGKGRQVPIHSAILPLVRLQIALGRHSIFHLTQTAILGHVHAACERYGISEHTAHDCRHTFSRLCEKYGVAENDRKRMLGHSFGSDLTNAVYGHRDLADLRREIEKIQVCDNL